METSKQDAQESAEIEIRALRRRSNAAIAGHDVGSAVAIMRDDVKIIASDGNFIDGAPAMARVFDRIFSDPTFVTYVREPVSIELGDGTAAELGTWDGRWKTAVVRGTYMARWQYSAIGWRIASEFYIPLAVDNEQGGSPAEMISAR